MGLDLENLTEQIEQVMEKDIKQTNTKIVIGIIQFQTMSILANYSEFQKIKLSGGGNYFPCLWLDACKGFIFWHKGNPVSNFSDGELAWTSFDKPAKQFDFRYYGSLQGNTISDRKIHPTQKPIELYTWLLTNYAKAGDLILDTHVGSASSLIACHQLGFSVVGCELDKDYYEMAKKRIKEYTDQMSLF